MNISTKRHYARLIREMGYRNALVASTTAFEETERLPTIKEHAEKLGVSVATLKRAIAWAKKQPEGEHLIQADQHRVVLQALDRRHSLLTAKLEKMHEIEDYTPNLSHEMVALNKALMAIEQQQERLLAKTFSMGELLVDKHGLFHEGEPDKIERWREISEDICGTIRAHRYLLETMGYSAEEKDIVLYGDDEEIEAVFDAVMERHEKRRAEESSVALN